jgi:hypothetical protein
MYAGLAVRGRAAKLPELPTADPLALARSSVVSYGSSVWTCCGPPSLAATQTAILRTRTRPNVAVSFLLALASALPRSVCQDAPATLIGSGHPGLKGWAETRAGACASSDHYLSALCASTSKTIFEAAVLRAKTAT